jgi:hypothetical protein
VGEWAEELKTWRDAHRYELNFFADPKQRMEIVKQGEWLTAVV